MVVVAAAGVAYFVWPSAEEKGTTGAKADLPAEAIGFEEADASPEKGATLRAGVAEVEIRPLALASPAHVKAELRADRTLTVTLDPPQELLFPALVTLPLPPDAVAGDDPATWPVAVLDPAGKNPAILRAEAIDAASFQVEAPHFSEIVPMQHGQALKHAGGATLQPGAPYAPADFDVEVKVQASMSPGAAIDTVTLVVTPKAHTSVNNGRPQLVDGKLTPDWSRFSSLSVAYYWGRPFEAAMHSAPRESRVSENGAPVSATVPQWQPTIPFDAVYVALFDSGGNLIVGRTVKIPMGPAWGLVDCPRFGAFDRFNVYYLRDPASTGYPDTGYTGSEAPGTIPQRAIDTCKALTFAYRTFNGPAWFNNDRPPGIPIDAWLQPWDESQAGNLSGTIYLKTTSGDYDDFKRSAAHELAHLFQYRYSMGFTGAWFHDASAEYLANRIYGPDENVAPYELSGDRTWMSLGLVHGTDVAHYSASSFLAYLSSQFGINIAQVWVQGGSGISNASSWEKYLDGLVRARGSSLDAAWHKFAEAFFLDHAAWGQWEGISLEGYELERISLAADPKYPKFSLSGTASLPVRNLSAGGAVISYNGAPAVTIGLNLSGSARRSGYYDWAAAGAEPGSPAQRLTSVPASFRLGNTTGALGPETVLRFVYLDEQWDPGSWTHGGFTYQSFVLEAWALPQLANVKLEGTRLTWDAAPLDKLGAKADRYEIVAERKEQPGTFRLLTTASKEAIGFDLPADLKQTLADENLSDQVCVRLRDVYGFTSPEACTAEGVIFYSGKTADGGAVRIKVDYTANSWVMLHFTYPAYETRLPNGAKCTSTGGDMGAEELLKKDPAADTEPEAFWRYYISGVLVPGADGLLELKRAPLPDKWKGEKIPLYISEGVGKVDASRSQINGSVPLYMSDIMGCPLVRVSYGATRE